MKDIISIALLSLKEGLRQRILFGVLVLAILIMMFAVLISGMFMRDLLKIILDICLAAVTAGGLLVPLFIAVNMLAGDIEQRTIFTILARPISRT